VANINFNALMFPALAGVASGGGEAIALNHRKENSPNEQNFILANAGAVADFAVGGWGIANYAMDMGFPRQGTVEFLGAGTAIVTRRLTSLMAQFILDIQYSASDRTAVPPRYSPILRTNGSYPARAPSAVVESSTQPRKRQFFSVT
jgi:hypothetical protein